MKLDYCIVIFSGHGGQERQVVIELNSQHEIVYEYELKNISTKQLTIFDCCRGVEVKVQQGGLHGALKESFSNQVSLNRFYYENRIMQAIFQQVTLYSCSIGQLSNDTNQGGLYSKNFITCAYNFDGKYKLVSVNHQEASFLTELNNNQQKPDAILPRCLSNQQLIISINSKK